MSESKAGDSHSPHFSVSELSLRFADTTALDSLSLDVQQGEVVGILGPSGSGKSSLLALLNGVYLPTEGTVHSLGEDFSRLDKATLKALRSRIGWIPQDYSLVPNLRVLQNVLMGRMGRQSTWQSVRSFLFPRSKEKEKVYELLRQVGIPEKIFQRTDTLSGGQQQRVALARCLYQKPKAILADEPLSSIDPSRAADLMNLLLKICQESKITLLVTLHDIELARQYFPRLVALREGRLVFDGLAKDLTDKVVDEIFKLSSLSK